jgi:hypothetical protein
MTAIHAIERAARDAGYRLNIATIDEATGRDEIEHLAQSVAALVVLSPQMQVLAALDALRARIPIVRLDPSGVVIDQVAGARLATQHLIAPGHKRIVHVAGPADWVDADGRAEGFAIELAGSGPSAPPIAHRRRLDRGLRLLDRPKPPAGPRLYRRVRGERSDGSRLHPCRTYSASRSPATSAWSASTTSLKPHSLHHHYQLCAKTSGWSVNWP